MSSTITRSPTPLIHRLNAGPWIGDHVVLSMQYRKYISTGTITLSRAVVFFPLWNRTTTPAAIRNSKMRASKGLPSSVAARTPPEEGPATPNQLETDLDPAIQIQITGSQRALELRTDLSRSKKKSPATTTLQIRKANGAPIQFSIGATRAPPADSVWCPRSLSFSR